MNDFHEVLPPHGTSPDEASQGLTDDDLYLNSVIKDFPSAKQPDSEDVDYKFFCNFDQIARVVSDLSQMGISASPELTSSNSSYRFQDAYLEEPCSPVRSADQHRIQTPESISPQSPESPALVNQGQNAEHDEPTKNNNPEPYLIDDPQRFSLPEALITFEQLDAAKKQSSFDLTPSFHALSPSGIESLLDRLFSLEHMKTILRDSSLSTPFYEFLRKHRPESLAALKCFIDTQKALAAIEYANVVSQSLSLGSATTDLADEFVQGARQAISELVWDVMPAYITHSLVTISTEILVKEITGQNVPVLRGLVGGLAEVYCLTDPNLPDNPIVYASEEFFRYTQYGRDFVIGRNCRFLQGPKSSGASIQRLADAVADGKEICETMLNYRRDGSSFVNLLTLAPLFDNNGCIRYYIGAQIDVTRLVEHGRGLESFEKLLLEESAGSRESEPQQQRQPRMALRELGEILDDEDVRVLEQTAQRRKRNSRSDPLTGASHPTRPPPRKYVGMGSFSDDRNSSGLHTGSMGKLPGVFQSSRFLDHIGGPSEIRNEIATALKDGTSVTAKINWFSQRKSSESRPSRPSTPSAPSYGMIDPDEAAKPNDSKSKSGKLRWIHCTPLVGSDRQVGVWMIVIVENESVTGNLNVTDNLARSIVPVPVPVPTSSRPATSNGIRPGSKQHSYTSYGVTAATKVPSKSPTQTSLRAAPAASRAKGAPLRSDRLFRDYFRREGRPDSSAGSPPAQMR